MRNVRNFPYTTQISVSLHGEAALEREVIVDTTVQEKNITFPTDTKLRVKVISRCWKIVEYLFPHPKYDEYLV